MGTIAQVGDKTYLIDVEERGQANKTAAYVLKADRPALVDTGPASGVPLIIEGLKKINIEPKDVEFIFLTHIHLDHGGGAGLLLKQLPRATVMVHQRGVRHMVAPERLVAGATAVHGPEGMKLLGEVVPADPGRVKGLKEGDAVDLGGRQLTIMETPGHAPHQVAYFDSLTRGVFCGDALGACYNSLTGLYQDLVLPITPPPNPDLALLVRSQARIALNKPEVLFFPHFGPSLFPGKIIERATGQLVHWVEMARELRERGASWSEVEDELLDSVSKSAGWSQVPVMYNTLRDSVRSSMMGLTELIGKD